MSLMRGNEAGYRAVWMMFVGGLGAAAVELGVVLRGTMNGAIDGQGQVCGKGEGANMVRWGRGFRRERRRT
jgi:hypothetical protein